MKQPKVSLIFPCYNSEGVVVKRIRNIIKNTRYVNYEIIAIDDGSKDNTFGRIIKKFSDDKRVKIFRNKKNLGVAATKNYGIRKAKGKYVTFLETDMEVSRGWLTPIVKELENDNKIAGAQSRILDFKHRNLIQMCGLEFIPQTFWVVSRGFSQNKNNFIKKEVTGIGTGGSTLRKSVLKRIGYYDEKCEYSQGDADSNWAIWMSGYKTITVPDSTMFHVTGKPSNKANVAGLEREFHFHKTPRVFIKNYELVNIIRFLPQLYIIYILRILVNLRRLNYKPLMGMLMAAIWNIWYLPDTLMRRNRIQQLRKIKDSEIMEKICIKGNFLSIYKTQLAPILKVYFSKETKDALLRLNKKGFKNV